MSEPLKLLKNDLLIQTYYKAIELRLADEFILLLEEEIKDRKLFQKLKKTC